MIFYRKNFSAGVLDVALKAAPDYTGDPGYDEIAVVDGHTLPSSLEVDVTDQFTLVIWSNTVNPGDDPNMEIVTATRTAHPRVYQVVDRGLEDTDIVAHPVGSYVGLHYTAGVSNADLEPILDILAAGKGSLIYTWLDVFGNKFIEILPPGSYGQVLVTGGSSARPFWDWVWESPGASGGFVVVRYPEIDSGATVAVFVADKTQNLTATTIGIDYGTNLGPYEDEFKEYDMDDFISTKEDQIMDFTGASYSDGYQVEEDTPGKLMTEIVTTKT